MIDLTIVIPTYNRRALLRDAVASLRHQTCPADRYEILIISDGCSDGTDEDYATPLTGPDTRLVRQEKKGFGLARARNLGTKLARGKLVMFFDDDMLAEPGLVAAHLAAHERYPEEAVAVCGRVKLASDLPQTPFCQIVLGDICRLFAPTPDEPRWLDFAMSISWQTSYKKTQLERVNGFDENFRSYGWEDIEFSYRVTQQGMRFWLEPGAVSQHRDQRYTLETHGERMRNSARMAPVLFQRHPALRQLIPLYADKAPIVWGEDAPALIARKLMRSLMAAPPVMAALKALTPVVEKTTASRALLGRWYYLVLGNYSHRGYRQGLAEFAANNRTPVTVEPQKA
jgi:GT2 family glycosyltransferase